MFSALDIVQIKEGDVFKLLAAGPHLGSTNLDFQMEQYIYKRKVIVSTLILERTLENLLPVAHAIVAIENPDDISIISFRKTGQLFVVSCLLLPLEKLLLLVALLLEPSLTGSRQPMGAATSGDY